MKRKTIYTILLVMSCLMGCSVTENKSAQPLQQSNNSTGSLSAIDTIKTIVPNANVETRDRDVQRIYGPMAKGKTPQAAATEFLNQSAAAFGLTASKLVADGQKKIGKTNGRHTAAIRLHGTKNSPVSTTSDSEDSSIGLMYDPQTGQYKFRLYRYQQQQDGVPVYGAGLKTLVRLGNENQVVWAGMNLKSIGDFNAKADAGAFTVNQEKTLQAARANALINGQQAPEVLVHFTTPQKVIFAGAAAETQPPRLAMRFSAEAVESEAEWTFIADAESGDILNVESNSHAVINGAVKADVIMGLRSMECDMNTMTTAGMPYVRVTMGEGDDAEAFFADKDGAFTIPVAGGGTAVLSSEISGKYFTINNYYGALPALTQSVPTDGTAHFIHRNSYSNFEETQAQYLAYKAANDIRDYLFEHVPEHPVFQRTEQLPIWVNISSQDMSCSQSGGGLYHSGSKRISLCRRNDAIGVTNAAFASIVHHEYGHFIVDMADGGTLEYGEGMADTTAMLFSKDSRLGYGYELNQCSVSRRDANNDCMYDANECSTCGGYSDIHGCGRLLSGVMWDIWQNLIQAGIANAEHILAKLAFNSIQLHIGHGIDASIAIDMLTLDDDDGTLKNGTPHADQICAAFEAHGMSCPGFTESGLIAEGLPFHAEGPSNGPFAPAQTTYTVYNENQSESMYYAVVVRDNVNWLTVENPLGMIEARQSATINVSIDETQAQSMSDDTYEATIDVFDAANGNLIDSFEATLRVGAPVPIYIADFDNDMEGFTTNTPEYNLWHRSTACQDVLPGHSAAGSLYCGKDTWCNYSTGMFEMHNATSPVINVSNPDEVLLGFNYYLRTDLFTQTNAETDVPEDIEVRVSVNGGPFETVASLDKGGVALKQTSSWTKERIDISYLMPQSGPVSIQLQFGLDGAADKDYNAQTGFVVDDITVYAHAGCTTDAQCDDNNPCTTDTCNSTGACVNTDNGSCGSNPCALYCANPVVYDTASYQSGNLGSSATCHETSTNLSGGICGNFESGRKLFVNGVEMACDWNTHWTLPTAQNGGYCITTTDGGLDWAAFTTW
ncbi:MAG: hypothetical protein JXR76_00190 [Deltaproteobacteria bacterium]|nr:hypothetical protein [Deltaproteobacteria bacterium]